MTNDNNSNNNNYTNNSNNQQYSQPNQDENNKQYYQPTQEQSNQQYYQPPQDQNNQQYYQPPQGNQQYYQQPYGQQTYGPMPPQEEKASVGLAILSFIIPLAGLIIFLVKKDSRPKTAKVSGICALVSFIINIIFTIVIYGVMGTAMFSGVTEDAINDFSYYEEFDANDYDYNDADDYNYDYNLEEEATQEITSASSSDSSLTLEQQNAIRSVESYLSFTSFSRTGLIDQLEYEGYSTETATFAVDNYNIDWNEQAAKKAQEYLDFSSFSRDELIDQLEYEGFTAEQAEYGVTAVGY